MTNFEEDHDIGKMSRVGSGNTCYHSVQNAHVLIYRTDIVTVILCGSGIWCLMSREDHRLMVCESRGVRRIFDVRGR